MASHVELYEALKGPVGEQAARMIAEVVPPAANLATKQDLAELGDKLMGRLWVMFVPMWIGLYGLIATLLIRT